MANLPQSPQGPSDCDAPTARRSLRWSAAIAAGVGATLVAAQLGGPAAGASPATRTTTASIRFVGASDAGGGNARSKHLRIPSRARSGETALLFLARSTSARWSAPYGVGGWHQVASFTAHSLRTTVWRKTLGSHDHGKTVWIRSAHHSHAALNVAVYSGVSTTSPVAVAARHGQYGSSRHVTPRVSTSRNLAVSYWADRNAAAVHYRAPHGVAVRTTTPDSGRTLTVQTVVADSGAMRSSGHYGGLTATTTHRTHQSIAWSILLRPAIVRIPIKAPPAPKPPTTSPTPPTTSPTPPTTSPTPPTGSSSCVSDPRGIPAPGTGALVGATASGTQTMTSLVANTGSLHLYRDYYMPNQVAYAVERTKAQLAQGMLPWISFKLPYSWSDMAAGKGDAWADGLIKQLAAINGPIWLAFQHEPENDTTATQTMADWSAMERHLSDLVHTQSHNIAFTIILMAWNALYGPAVDHLPTVWPGDGKVDILGFDLYDEYGAKAGHGQLDYNKYFGAIQAFSAAHGHVPWALGETAYTQAAQENAPTFLQSFYASLLSHGGVGMAYFDSSYNSIANWTLTDPARQQAFAQVLKSSLALCRP